jgi:hypothetical protein
MIIKTPEAATLHSLGALTLTALTIINNWPWQCYLVATGAMVIALGIAAVSTPSDPSPKNPDEPPQVLR